MFKGVVSEELFKRLLLIILGIFCLFSFISALVVYKNSQVSLGPHYGAAHVIVTSVKESLIIITVKINLIFYLLTAIGVAILGILYSHRVAGPLVQVKQYAEKLGEGRFDERIRFRKKDAIHYLASEFNEMAKGCQERTGILASELNKLEEDLLLLNSMPDKSEEKIELIKKIRKVDVEIRDMHQTLIL